MYRTNLVDHWVCLHKHGQNVVVMQGWARMLRLRTGRGQQGVWYSYVCKIDCCVLAPDDIFLLRTEHSFCEHPTHCREACTFLPRECVRAGYHIWTRIFLRRQCRALLDKLRQSLGAGAELAGYRRFGSSFAHYVFHRI